jgi:hypothetical protein
VQNNASVKASGKGAQQQAASTQSEILYVRRMRVSPFKATVNLTGFPYITLKDMKAEVGQLVIHGEAFSWNDLSSRIINHTAWSIMKHSGASIFSSLSLFSFKNKNTEDNPYDKQQSDRAAHSSLGNNSGRRIMRLIPFSKDTTRNRSNSNEASPSRGWSSGRGSQTGVSPRKSTVASEEGDRESTHKMKMARLLGTRMKN